MPFTIPNMLSLFRLLMSFACLILFSQWQYKIPVLFILLVFVSISDYLDGYFARIKSQTTRFGGHLDRMADHCFLSVTAVVFLWFDLLPLWLVIIYLLRNHIINTVRSYDAHELGIPQRARISCTATFYFYIVLLLPLVDILWSPLWLPPYILLLAFVASGLLELATLFYFGTLFIKKSRLR